MVPSALIQQLLAIIMQLQLLVANMQVPEPPKTIAPTAKITNSTQNLQTPTAKVSSAGAGQIPFGGRIVEVVQCCTGTAIIVGPPNPGFFSIVPGTTIYRNANIYTIGTWVLGNAAPGGVCDVAPLCVPTPTDGTVSIIGTS